VHISFVGYIFSTVIKLRIYCNWMSNQHVSPSFHGNWSEDVSLQKSKSIDASLVVFREKKEYVKKQTTVLMFKWTTILHRYMKSLTNVSIINMRICMHQLQYILSFINYDLVVVHPYFSCILATQRTSWRHHIIDWLLIVGSVINKAQELCAYFLRWLHIQYRDKAQDIL
jgi:hypothetical protein